MTVALGTQAPGRGLRRSGGRRSVIRRSGTSLFSITSLAIRPRGPGAGLGHEPVERPQVLQGGRQGLPFQHLGQQQAGVR